MKKIYCDWSVNDFLQIEVVDGSNVIITAKQNENKSRVRINPDKIRKLRKQLKRALIEIEGEKKEDDWFSAGKIVRVTNNFMGHCFPIGDMVRIVDINEGGVARAEYLGGRDYWFLRKNECEPAA